MRPSEPPATRRHHPARRTNAGTAAPWDAPRIELPPGRDVIVRAGERAVRLTNLDKPYFSTPKLAKRDLLQFYADVSPWLLPHVVDRAMVMRRYPQGADGPSFFMKRAPPGRPEWLELCSIEHASGNVIDFPVIQDLAGLLWIVNLGCIDLNPSYARCDDVDRPDFLHFDLDPGPGVPFARVRDAALVVHEALDALKLANHVKTTGSKGMHVYVPIERGPLQHEVWGFAKALAQTLAKREPSLLTAEYKIAKRPRGRVLVDYNQNAWGRTLASIYSVRPKPHAPVSMPVTWDEVRAGVEIEDFRIDNALARLHEVGDLWAPVLAREGRVDLRRFL